MYFPYLNTSGVENTVIKELICKLETDSVMPIVNLIVDTMFEENKTNSIIKMLKELVNSKRKFILTIDNSTDENFINRLKLIDNFNDYCIYGISDKQLVEKYNIYNIAILHYDTTLSDISNNINIKYHIFLPNALRVMSYINKFPQEKRVKIEDNFKSQSTNREYPPESIFSDSYKTYKESGFIGFGDYTIMSENFDLIQAGGANLNNITATIHLNTIIDNVVYTKHFLTTPTEEPSNSTRPVKTLLKAKQYDFEKTQAIDLIDSAIKRGSTSLAYLKRIGIQHHIELMAKNI